MKIRTTLPREYIPKRVIHGPQGHEVGGKATPWWLKARGYIEVAIWAAGCNLRCPQCQNYSTTYDGRGKVLTPKQAAEVVTLARRSYKVDRMAISGGEPTLNRPWLLQFFKELKRLNPDKDARLHLDSNGTILTKGYIDELILDAQITDIGIEPKGIRVETFMKITGIRDEKLALRYQHTQWEAIRYVVENYLHKVFLGVGLPYNNFFITMDEVSEFGSKLAAIDPEVQVCVLDYFPTFRRREINRPSPEEMLKVKRTLEEAGLKTVIVQTTLGHLGP
jgi:pyruvate formate lyase activating enzyme